MHPTALRWSLLAIVAVVVVLSMLPLARSQIQTAPSYIPIGAAASGNASVAWFHQPASGTVVACQAGVSGAGTIAPIQCVAARLP
ncbi:MAG: hypothetical protein IT531_05770 [Burkholderiales bacterium]|nr:hypothetical protein [Burkholderiales bacterium]